MANRDTKDPRDLRYRKQLFPDAEGLVFRTEKAGFVPLPILFRKLFRKMTAAQVRLFVYLLTRTSQHGICYPTLEEIAYDLGLSGRKNVLPHLKSLETLHLISRRNSAGKNYYLIHDPRVALQHLADHGQLSNQELAEINDLCEDLRQESIQPRRRALAASVGGNSL